MKPAGTIVPGASESWRLPGSVGFGLALLLPLTVFGFWKTYFGILDDLPDTFTAVTHVHAALMFLWLLMLVAQAWFIRTRRLRVHRWVGRSSYLIAPLIVLSGVATLHKSFNDTPGGVPADLARLDVMAFGMLLAFAVTWGLGIAYRRRPALHVPFMVSTGLSIATAIVWRIFYYQVPGLDTDDRASVANVLVLGAVCLGLVALDWRRGVRRSPYWVVTLLLGLQPLGYWGFARTGGWLAFCQWFADV